MGVKRLLKKDELRYRKGSTNESRNCKWCRFYMRTNAEGRCSVMGIDAAPQYRIREDFTCDAQVTTYRNPYGK